MRRINWKTVSTLATIAFVAGCSDSAVAPKAERESAPAAMAFAPEGRPSLLLTGQSEDNQTTTFTVGARGGVFFAGNHAVYFPANSICDPATNSYGIGTWDDSCTLLNHTITVTAITRVAYGRTQVDFTPSLRFAPSSDPSRWVWMFMYTPNVIGVSDFTDFKIYYAPTLDGPLYDESLSDSSLRTYVDTRSGISIRRIKHFSGYTSSGLNCPPDSEDPECGAPPPPPIP